MNWYGVKSKINPARKYEKDNRIHHGLLGYASCWSCVDLRESQGFRDVLIVGVFTDGVIKAKDYKGCLPIITCTNRIRMLLALKCVDIAIPLDRREYLCLPVL